VASALETDPRATWILLNALTALGLLEKEEPDYRLSPLAKTYLHSPSSRCLSGMVAFEGHLWDLWGRLEETIRTGRPVRDTAMFQHDPGETALFIDAMDSLVRGRGDADYLAQSLNWGRVRRLLDIGSGPATYPIAFCRENPHLNAVIFDLPGTLAMTRRYVEAAEMAGRIRLEAGDYNRDPLPGGFDRVFLSNIIHGEDERHNRDLMKKVYDALTPGGEIVIKDHVMDPTLTQPAAGAVFSLQMLMTNPGRDYGLFEVRQWLEEAGFSGVVETALPPPMTSSLVTAVKP
jgi:SAM-dependent methyltransferase